MPYRNLNTPLGQSVPQDNPHAVSVSLPKFEDVINYEENKNNWRNILKSGYPRFIKNRFVARAEQYISEKIELKQNETIVTISSEKALSAAEKNCCCNFDLQTYNNLSYIKIDTGSKDFEKLTDFLQHTGYIVSSRKAEDFLLKENIITEKFSEELTLQNPESIIKTTLSEAYSDIPEENIFLANTGMNAIYSAFEAIKKVGSMLDKKIFIRLGWMYLDTIEILKKYSEESTEFVDVSSLSELETYLAINGNNVAAIFTEVPSNPLIKTPDLQKLRILCDEFDIILAVDSTVATPFNIELSDYVDVILESLTKFASGGADLLMGAAIVNEKREFRPNLKTFIAVFAEAPFEGELSRLAYQIKDYEARVKKCGSNTKKIIEYLNTKSSISKIHHCYACETGDFYNSIEKAPDSYSALISLEFNKPFAEIYDKLSFPKGPSLGTNFTLAMPYVYLAHWDQAKSLKGRKELLSTGLNPDLLRISVGTEPIDQIIEVFEKSL